METSPKPHSPFLPLQLLVVFLGAWIGYQIFALNEDRLGAEARIQQAIPQANAALAAKKRLLDLAQEVNQLAAKDATAAQIVDEFQIRVQSGSKPAPAPAAK